jgi:Fe-S-cluster containining protein
MSIVSIGDVLVERELLDARFSCPLELCRGACCVEGELGAPIDVREQSFLQSAVESVRDKLSEKNLRYIRRHGCTEIYQGSLYTRTIEGRECVFVVNENGVALCSVESGKPLSCSLFPIRVRKKFGLDYLVYEQHAMCREARKKGAEQNVRLIDFVGASLVKRYGEAWYGSLKEFVDSST